MERGLPSEELGFFASLAAPVVVWWLRGKLEKGEGLSLMSRVLTAQDDVRIAATTPRDMAIPGGAAMARTVWNEAILLADQLNNASANECLIWESFAKRGLGFGALQGDADDKTDGTDQFVEKVSWLLNGQVNYHLGMDGISLVLVMLTTILGPIIVLSTWTAVTDRVASFLGFLLFLQAAMLGTFFARDMLLFYVFWEAMLIPMYFIIGVWGGQRRIYAAVKFFIFTMVGSVFMLIAIIYLFFQAGSMSLTDFLALDIARDTQLWLFAAFFLAFAIKVPLFPLHTWLPDAHVEAPTAGSVVLAGVLLKMGIYGMLRFAMPLFPEAVTHFAPAINILAVIGIIYGALVALVQPDMKKLVAYSSVSHMGFIVLGLFSLSSMGAAGGIFQMLGHGLGTGALFLLVGIIYERRHTREISEFGGLAHRKIGRASCRERV